MKTTASFIVITFLFIFYSCRDASINIINNDVVGAWRLGELNVSTGKLKVHSATPFTFHLERDGKFIASAVPPGYFFNNTDKPIIVNGKWKIHNSSIEISTFSAETGN